MPETKQTLARTKAKSEQIDRLVSAAEHVLTAMTELSCTGRHVSSSQINLRSAAESIVTEAGAVASSDDELLRIYGRPIQMLASRVEASR